MIALALGWTVVHSVWELALIALAYAVVCALEARPAARYVAGCFALSAMMAAPVLTFVRVVRVVREMAGVAAPVLSASHADAPVISQASLVPLVGAAWCLGAGCMLVRLAGSAARVAKLRRLARPLGGGWEELSRRLAHRLGLRVPVVVAAARVTSPGVVGWLRPMIVLPLAMVANAPRDVVEAVLAHELAHVRRFDFLANALQAVVEALLFYHPCVHWLSRRVRAEREHCCDDVATRLVGDPVAYARALVFVEELRAEGLAPSVAMKKGPLMTRIDRLFPEPAAHASSRSRPLVAIVAALAIAAGSALACGDTALETHGSVAAADGVPPLPAKVTRWMPEIFAAGERYGVDPRLLAAVTALESGGDPDAVSPGGSVGLLQLMPATAQAIATERGLGPFGVVRLHEPATNLDFGAYYLASQLAAFGANQPPERAVELAAAAYNAGPERVHAWLEQGTPLPDEATRYKANVVRLWQKLRVTQ